MAKSNIEVKVKLLNTKQIKKDYSKFMKLYTASKEILNNYAHWLDTVEVANKKESKRLYTNLKKAVEACNEIL